MMPFDPKNWFWLVGGDASKAWSSAATAYVSTWDEDRLSRIANEIELYDVLARQKLKSKAPQGPFAVADLRSALLRIDAAATGDAQSYAELSAIAEEIGFELPAV